MASSYDLGLVKFPFGSGVSSIAASIVLSLPTCWICSTTAQSAGLSQSGLLGRGSMLHWTAAETHSTAETYCDSFRRLFQRIRIRSGATELHRKRTATELVVLPSSREYNGALCGRCSMHMRICKCVTWHKTSIECARTLCANSV